MSTQEERIVRARSRLMLRFPLLGFILLGLELVEDKTHKTGWTNGVKLGYNPDWLKTQSFQKLVGWTVHEAAHVFFKHHLRRNGRNDARWNQACDWVINAYLKFQENFQLPDDGLIDEQYIGQYVEKVYSDLKKAQPPTPTPEKCKETQNGQSDTKSTQSIPDLFSPGNSTENNKNQPNTDKNQPENVQSDPNSQPWGEVKDFPVNVTESEAKQAKDMKQAEQELDTTIAQATMMQENHKRSNDCGNEQGFYHRMTKELLDNKVHWTEELQKFVENITKNDYSWMRPNKRYHTCNFIIPSLYTRELGIMYIGIDASGSIGSKEFKIYGSELSHMLTLFPTLILRVYYFDTRVMGNYKEFTINDIPIKLDVIAGGGTRFTPIFNKIEIDDVEPVCLIIFTDLGSNDYPNSEPNYPVLWIATDNYSTPPFGKVTYVRDWR